MTQDTDPQTRGRWPYRWKHREGGPPCWACDEIMTECSAGLTLDIWHCTDPDCDVTETVHHTVRSRGEEGGY